MKKLKLIATIFFASWLLSSPLLAQSTTWGFRTFGNFGIIHEIRNDSLFISDMKFRVSPTAKLSTVDKSDASMGLLKKNQAVGFTYIFINNRLLIDHLWLIPDNERSSYGLL